MKADPAATYRVQFNPGFTLQEASAIVDYLAELGISHLYTSPYLQAAPGSMHGYDVVDPHRVNVELGGEQAHTRLVQTLQAQGLGQVLDIVPNHMAIGGPQNPWWWDVLENGPSSRYASYFDVEWDPPEARHMNEVLVPVLGDHYGRVLEAGEIRLEYVDERRMMNDEGGKTEDEGSSGIRPSSLRFSQGRLFVIRHHENTYPANPRSLSSVLAAAAARANSDRLAFLAGALDNLPLSTATDRASAQRRYHDTAVIYDLLRRLVEEQPLVRSAIGEVVEEINRDPDQLDLFLQWQNYRLAYWRMASRELGYRRFFDINSLIGLRMEDEQVFRDTHALVLDWLREGLLDGLRIDHPDGLLDPGGYFQRLRQAAGPETWIVIEKIVEPGERIPEEWPVAGTTGYDFMFRVNNLFVDPQGEAPLTEFYARFTGRATDWPAIVRASKLQVLNEVLGSDVNRLTELFLQVCERHRRHRDYTRSQLRQALSETAACLPVYRTYVRAGAGTVHDTDEAYVDAAIQEAKANRPELEEALFDFLRDLLLLRVRGEVEDELVMRFQQLTGPAMAKGVEDTAFYNFYRLASLNEVGGSPGQFGISLEEFHRACAETQRRWPESMLSTSTHDTKRSEDVRARLSLLSEIPETWEQAVGRWSGMNERYRSGGWPDRNDEYLFYQTLVSAWPIELERVQRYMEKACREAKVHTSWINPDPDYERAVADFVKGALGDEVFVRDLQSFVAPLVEPGRINSLAQTLIKLTSPGVPDIYQGTELWSLTLVDPDNRQPVDYDLRRRLHGELDGGLEPEQIQARSDEGLPKLWVIRQALALRRRRPDLFGSRASYHPLPASGEGAVAFARGDGTDPGAVTVVPRLVLSLREKWDETRVDIPAGRWRSELTGESVAGGEVPLSRLLARFPVCLLAKE